MVGGYGWEVGVDGKPKVAVRRSLVPPCSPINAPQGQEAHPHD